MIKLIRKFKFILLCNILIFILEFFYRTLFYKFEFFAYITSYSYVIMVLIASAVGLLMSKMYYEITFTFPKKEYIIHDITDLLINNGFIQKSDTDNLKIFVKRNQLLRLYYAYEDKVKISIYTDYFEVSISKMNKFKSIIERLNYSTRNDNYRE